MPLIPLSWLADWVELTAGADAESVAADLVAVGLEEESIIGARATGPLVVGQVLEMVGEEQKNGKTINWCRVDVGPEHNEDADHPKFPQPGTERPSRGIVCGAHNFTVGDKVVVSLPGAVLPGDFAIAGRKTYGHFSDGMICSGAELGLPGDAAGIIVLGEGDYAGLDSAAPGADAIPLLGLDEQVVEINVTPDRGYCFSIRGVAREYGHSTGNAFTDPALAVEVPAATGPGHPVILSDDAPLRGQVGCDRYVALRVSGIDPTAPTPKWMRDRLTLAGMRPISLAVDVTNYTMLELGQPLHAFDAHQVSGPIVVRRARPGERLTTLDDTDRALDPEDLLITDSGDGAEGSRIIGIAGVMGGAGTEVGSTTTDILLEGAHFSSLSIARTARRHRLPSEASKRFERGVDPQLAPVAVLRAAQLLAEHGGGSIATDRTDAGSVPAPQPIRFPLAETARLTGVEHASARQIALLETIGATVTPVDDAELAVVPPSWRPDLTHKSDLVEEIARLDGYENIPSVVPSAPGGKGLTRTQTGRRAVALTLADAGLDEVLSYPFTAAAVFEQHLYPQDDERREAVSLLNPLSDAEPLLRTALLQTLLPTAVRNLGRGAEDLAVFEIGLVTRPEPGERPAAPSYPTGIRPTAEELAAVHAAVPAQPRHIAGVLVGHEGPTSWFGPARAWDYADAVALALAVGRAVGVDLTSTAAQQAPWHPGRCAALHLPDGSPVGHAGELHPRLLKDLGLPARSAGFELDLDAVLAAAPAVVEAEPVPTFPVAKEDLAFVVPADIPSLEVEAAVAEGFGDLLEAVQLFDVYEGDQIPAGHRSLAYSVRLRSATGTLTGDQLTAARRRAVTHVAETVGGQLRA